jgi:hypothetical protein
MSPYVLPVEVIIVALVAVSGFFIKRWMDRAEHGWREQMDNFAKRNDIRLDKIETKIDVWMAGQSAFVTRDEYNTATARAHARIDELERQLMDLASRVGTIEGLNKAHD